MANDPVQRDTKKKPIKFEKGLGNELVAVIDNQISYQLSVKEAISSSNNVTVYTAIKWDRMYFDDETKRLRYYTSCNCPGWANRKKCKHADDAELLEDGVHLVASERRLASGPTTKKSKRKPKKGDNPKTDRPPDRLGRAIDLS